MIDHRTDFLEIKGLVNETINARIDGLFEEGILPFLHDEKDSRPVGLLNLEQQPPFLNPGTIRAQNKNTEMFFRKVRFNLVTAIQCDHLVAFPLQAFSQVASASKIVVDDANLTHHRYPPSK